MRINDDAGSKSRATLDVGGPYETEAVLSRVEIFRDLRKGFEGAADKWQPKLYFTFTFEKNVEEDEPRTFYIGHTEWMNLGPTGIPSLMNKARLFRFLEGLAGRKFRTNKSGYLERGEVVEMAFPVVGGVDPETLASPDHRLGYFDSLISFQDYRAAKRNGEEVDSQALGSLAINGKECIGNRFNVRFDVNEKGYTDNVEVFTPRQAVKL